MFCQNPGARVSRLGHRGRRCNHGDPEEWIISSGEWVNDCTHGHQFMACFARTAALSLVEGIEYYLGAGMIRVVGRVYTRKLIRAFSEKVFDVIEAYLYSTTFASHGGLAGNRDRFEADLMASLLAHDHSGQYCETLRFHLILARSRSA